MNPCLAVYCRKNNLGYSRLGLTVGVKLGKAVVRNRTAAESKRPTASMRGPFSRLRHRGGGPGAGCPQPLPGVGALAPVSGGQARPAPEGGGLIEAPASGPIRGYRTYISPSRPPCCRFIPTCSAYALEAVEKYGAWKGGFLALRRILKCQPFHKQVSIEYDPVP